MGNAACSTCCTTADEEKGEINDVEKQKLTT
jgi:hypothetical protein